MLVNGGPPAAAFEAFFDRGKVNIALNSRIMALSEKAVYCAKKCFASVTG